MQGRSSRGTTRLGEKSPTHFPYRGKRSSSKNVIRVFHYDWLAPTASSLGQGMKTLLHSLPRLKTICNHETNKIILPMKHSLSTAISDYIELCYNIQDFRRGLGENENSSVNQEINSLEREN